MEDESTLSVRLVLNDYRGLSRVTVGLESFLEFDIDLSCQLQTLVDRWSDFAPQIASRRRAARR